MTDLRFDVYGQDHGTGRILEELGRKADELKRHLDELGRTRADPSVTLDTAQAERQLKDIQADLAKLRNVKLQITADTARVKADINSVQRQLDELKAKSATVEVQADIAEAEAKLEELKAKEAELKDIKINADADTAAAKAKFEELKAKLAEIRDVHINVDLDTGGAIAHATAFRTVLSGLDNNGNILTRTLGAMATAAAAFGPAAVSAFGSLTSAAGSAITSVSSVFASMSGGVGIFQALGTAGVGLGQSLSSVGTQLSGLADSFTSPISAATQFAQTAAQLAIQLTTFVGTASAVAGAVSLLVAGISQAGGAIIALGSGIVPLVTSLGLLPGLLAPIGVGLGALAIGFSNSGKSGIEFKNTMDQLKSAFQPVIDSIRTGMQPAIQEFIRSIQSLAPIVQQVVPVITSAVSDVVNSVSEMFRSSSFQSDFQQLLTSAANNFRIMGDAARNAFQGITNVAVAAQPAVQQFLTFIDQGIQKWNEWTAAARQSGELTTIFNQAEQVLEQLIGTIGNVAGLFKNLWESANRTGAFQSVLTSINDLITRWRTNIQQVGGTWDQLMGRVRQIAPEITGLIGDIGEAFATIGANVDLGPAIQAIRGMIPSFTSAFTEIANAASNALKLVGPDISNIVASWGPQISATITNIAQLFHQWAPAIQAAGTAIITVANAIVIGLKSIGTAADATATAISAGWKALHGDLTGAASDWAQFEARQKTVWGSIQTGTQAAGSAVQGFGQTGSQAFASVEQATQQYNTAITAAQQSIQQFGASSDSASESFANNVAALARVRDAANNLQTAMQASGASVEQMAQKHQEAEAAIQKLGEQMGLTQPQIDAFKNSLDAIPPAKNVTITADASAALTAAQTTTSAILGIPIPVPSLFDGNAAPVQAAAGQAGAATTGVPAPPIANFQGNPSGAVSAAQQANAAIQGVQGKDIQITGNADSLTAATTAATNALAAIVDKNIKISAENNDLVIPAQGAVDALAAIVDKDVKITANNDQALQAIQQVQTALDNLHDKTVTVTTNYVTTGVPPGQAAGAILEPMAGGGITYGHNFGNLLPMAPGGLTPMSASTARIVQPNTWRVIGDRASGAEAFIPINRSPRSRALLHETARRMGEVTIPKQVIHYHRGGYWDWFRRHRTPREQPLPQQLMQTVGQPYTAGFGVGSSVGLSGSALPITPAMLSTYYNPGTRSIANMGVPSSSTSRPKQVTVSSDSFLIQAVLRAIRAEVRKQGGNVQVVLGN